MKHCWGCGCGWGKARFITKAVWKRHRHMMRTKNRHRRCFPWAPDHKKKDMVDRFLEKR